MQKWAKARRRAGAKIALVPTMGYLHEGHLSLIAKAKAKGADEIVVSVFVNPVQFGPNEDYAAYPRDEKADLAKCRAAGATAVFFPTPANMYLDRHSVYVVEEDLLVSPDFAVFGQKDYQQAQVIKRMVRDLNFGIEIIVAPIIREPSGLARSSRNTYLSADERARALAISRTLREVKSGKVKTVAAAAKAIARAGLKVDYVECVDAKTLEPRRRIAKGCCVLAAAYAGKTRLIDNVVV